MGVALGPLESVGLGGGLPRVWARLPRPLESGWCGGAAPHVPALSAACPPGRYGAACRLECSCQNNGTCEPATGACRCGPGFYGQACQHRESWGGDPCPASAPATSGPTWASVAMAAVPVPPRGADGLGPGPAHRGSPRPEVLGSGSRVSRRTSHPSPSRDGGAPQAWEGEGGTRALCSLWAN